MATDKEFKATGPGNRGFLTGETGIDVGIEAWGTSGGGVFHLTGGGPQNAAVWGGSPLGWGFLGGDAAFPGDRDVEPCGVYGQSDAAGGTGVHGVGVQYGVYGERVTFTGPPAVSYGFLAGTDLQGKVTGVFGMGRDRGIVGVGGADGSGGFSGPGSIGIYGIGETGIYGNGSLGVGVSGESATGNGVLAVSHALSSGNEGSGAAMRAIADEGAHGLWVETKGFKPQAAMFVGDVTITGDVILPGADCAEHFDTVGDVPAEPGSVMVIADDGRLAISAGAYDRRVAGVVSGAGRFRPGVILDAGFEPSDARARRPLLALIGKVFCKVDAEAAPIRIGDLLTTAERPGHAMKAEDSGRAFGAALGKALGTLDHGQGLIPILVALQ